MLTSNYSRVAKKFFDMAVEANAVNEYFPIWSTCLGFEMLVTLSVNETEIITNCSASNFMSNIEFIGDYIELSGSKMFNGLSQSLFKVC